MKGRGLGTRLCDSLEQVLACKEAVLSTGTVVVENKSVRSLNKTVVPSASVPFFLLCCLPFRESTTELWGGYKFQVRLTLNALSSARKLTEHLEFRAWRVLGRAPSPAACRSTLLRFVSSDGHVEMKWGASSSCAPQSLQDGSPRACPLLRELNLQASDSRPWQPRRRRILKLDQVVRWS